jgi:hypothetical protein
MAGDQDRNEAGQFEWVNSWAAAQATPAKSADPIVPAPTPAPVIAPVRIPDDQLMRDIAEIERVRDALAAVPVAGVLPKRRTQAFTLVPSRTTDPVPVVVGGVLALVMLTVFGAAAAMTKLAR